MDAVADERDRMPEITRRKLHSHERERRKYGKAHRERHLFAHTVDMVMSVKAVTIVCVTTVRVIVHDLDFTPRRARGTAPADTAI